MFKRVPRDNRWLRRRRLIWNHACGASPVSLVRHDLDNITQIFFPRSIENEILAHQSGIRSRGLFSSRHQLTFVSQEQENFGTYDVEDAQIDRKAVSPTLSLTPLPLFPSRALRSETQSPFSDPQQIQLQQQPPEYSEPVRLTPNRRAPSPNNNETPATTKPIFDKPLNDNVYRFNNPALQNSRVKKPSFRSPTGACFRTP